MFYDVDAVPILPLRCQHIFDDSERLLLRSWVSREMPWVVPDSNVFRRAADATAASRQLVRGGLPPGLENLDFMTTWPVVAPRSALPAMRAIVLDAIGGGCFDEALVRMLWFTHADLIAKATLTVQPLRARHSHCLPLPANATPQQAQHAIGEMLRKAGDDDFACVRYVAQTEHVRHPLRGCHTSCSAFKPYFLAAQYAHELLNESLAFERGIGPIPPRLFHYVPSHRTTPELERTRAFLLRRDPGRVCGVGRAHGHRPKLVRL